MHRLPPLQCENVIAGLYIVDFSLIGNVILKIETLFTAAYQTLFLIEVH